MCLSAFCCCDKIPEVIHLKGRKGYFGSWFLSSVTGFCCFGLVAVQYLMAECYDFIWMSPESLMCSWVRLLGGGCIVGAWYWVKLWHWISPLIELSWIVVWPNGFTENRNPALGVGGTDQNVHSLDGIERKRKKEGGLLLPAFPAPALKVAGSGLKPLQIVS